MPADVTVCLDDTTLTALDELAAETRQSRSTLVNEAILDYVALSASQIAKIKAGIEAADRGDFATEEELDQIESKLRAKL
jgi:predicted transcriptional regulator